MGRGDKRTKKGKIFAGSYGVSRPQRVKIEIPEKKEAKPKKAAAKKETKPKKAAAKKPAAKKASTKKSTAKKAADK